jgi:hypothetical protein
MLQHLGPASHPSCDEKKRDAEDFDGCKEIPQGCLDKAIEILSVFKT